MKTVLRRMTDADLPLFCRWLTEPHAARWFYDPEDWIREFKERNGEFGFIRHFIAEKDGVPFGFCQYYACRDSGETWNGYALTGGEYSIDYLIGETGFLHRGCGKETVYALLDKIKEHPDATTVIVQPEPENAVSRGLLVSCGFRYIPENDLFVRVPG